MEDVPGATPLERGAVNVGERVVRWTAWGDPNGPTVLDVPHVGVSGSRLPHVSVDAIRSAGIRLVAVARPGLGGSTVNDQRTIETDAEDTLRVADALGLERIVLVGECIGASNVLTVAGRHPERVERVVLLSPMAPFRDEDANQYLGSQMRSARFFHRFGPIARWLIRGAMKDVRRDPMAAIRKSIARMPAVDRPVASEPENMAVTAREFVDAFSDQRIMVAEFRILMAAWPIDARTVRTPTTIWHGAKDKTAPLAMGRWLSRRIERSRLEVLEDVGHLWAPEIERRVLEDIRADINRRTAS